MLNFGFIKSLLSEYGVIWLTNRLLYSSKLRLLNSIPQSESFFERKTIFPIKIDIFHLNINELKQFLQTLNQKDKTDIILVADKATRGVIYGFSSIDLDYGNPVDWHLNPLTLKRCDKYKKWFQIPDFDQERGDIKVIWEASRFSHFVTLARAYLLTEDIKYYNAFSNQLKCWLTENPYSFGANFKCGQECSIRMINALLSYTVFNNVGITTTNDEQNIKELVDRCYRKVLSNFFYAYKCIKNNHTISELVGMIVGAWCCEDKKQLQKAFVLLNEVIDEQFSDDGGYRQLSFNYQRLALQDLECILSIEPIVGYNLSKKAKEKIKNSALLMYQCQDETGDVPNYGSNDGALIFPVTSCGYRDFTPSINAIHALLTGKQLYDSGKHQEELIWFSAGKYNRDYKRENKRRESIQCKEAGLFTLRCPKAWAMVILNEYNSRPNHMDQLHFDLWVNGINVFCDSGTYSYSSELGIMLGKSASHNTAVINGREQMSSRGPFLTYGWSERRLSTCNGKQFEGTMISKNGFSHTRKIRNKGNTFLIMDVIEGSSEECRILFHTPCEVLSKGDTAKLYQNGNPICEIKSNGIIKITKCKRSLYYLKTEEINCIAVVVSNNSNNKIEIITEVFILNS